MNAPITNTIGAVATAEDLGQQLQVLRTDLTKLAAMVTEDVTGGIGEAGRRIGKTSHDARAKATSALLDHPLATIGIAAGLGLLLGLVTRRA